MNTLLQLDDTHRLRVSGLNWILERTVARTDRKTGKEYTDWEIVGYYSDLGPACRQHLRDKIMCLGEFATLTDLIAAIEACEARITAAVRAYTKAAKAAA